MSEWDEYCEQEQEACMHGIWPGCRCEDCIDGNFG